MSSRQSGTDAERTEPRCEADRKMGCLSFQDTLRLSRRRLSRRRDHARVVPRNYEVFILRHQRAKSRETKCTPRRSFRKKPYIRRLRGKLGAYGLKLSPAAKTDRERDNHRLTQLCPVAHPSGLKPHYREESQEQSALEECGKKMAPGRCFLGTKRCVGDYSQASIMRGRDLNFSVGSILRADVRS